MKRVHNLETAIEECKKFNLKYEWENAGKHIKFYINGFRIMISRNNDNPDRVRRDIRKVLTSK